MARHDIRGLKLSDGTYVFSSKDVYNLNDNFIQLSQEVFGNSNFSKDLGKQVKKNTASIEAITSTVGDLEADYTQVIQDVGNLSVAVVAADGKALNAQATADAVTLNFNNQKIGGRNLVKNGNFANNLRTFWDDWGVCGRSFTVIDGKPYLWLAHNTGETFRGILQVVPEIEHGKKYTLSFLARSSSGTTDMDVIIHQSGDGNNNPQVSTYFTLDETPKRYSFTFTATSVTTKNFFRIHIGKGATGYFSFYITDIMLQIGDKATEFSPKEGEFSATTHTFDGVGYSLKDSNGEALITPSGVANEQNIGRADNIENGYPMIIPFHIGSEVSQIKQAIIKWDMAKFRTYSKGAASGGGSTSGPSSKTTADNSGPPAFVSNTQTELSYPNEGKHYHRITAEQMAHSHGMAHTHTTPNHAHDPVYGILEAVINDFIVYVHVDGIHRASINSLRGEIDLSSWITTNGWHTIELRSPTLKRLDANLFLKTYIRR